MKQIRTMIEMMNPAKLTPFFAVGLLLAVPITMPAAEKPNLVLIIADDCTYLDLGVYGGQAKTPALDQLAGQGMQFSRCFQAA
ncbi:MAG: sulfatase atsG, partial [Planctomycetota bacterium]|nr:sulfatase atsG [Planctomycetota bacterium]